MSEELPKFDMASLPLPILLPKEWELYLADTPAMRAKLRQDILQISHDIERLIVGVDNAEVDTPIIVENTTELLGDQDGQS